MNPVPRIRKIKIKEGRVKSWDSLKNQSEADNSARPCMYYN
jgi:hypothetical protein